MELSDRLTPAEYHALGTAAGTNKYHVAAPQDRTYNGVRYHSKAEAQYAFELDAQLRQGLIRAWVRQHPFRLVVNGRYLCTYRADFVVLRFDGTQEVVEVKGSWPPVAKLKWALFLALYSEEFQRQGWTATVAQR